MNWLVKSFPTLKRTSLILTGETLRTRWVVVANCGFTVSRAVHSTFPVIRPASVVDGEVTWKIALTLAPAATASENVFDVLLEFLTRIVQPLRGTILNLTRSAGALVVLVNVKV